MKYKIGLIGKDIGFSKSPQLHQYIAKQLKVDLQYDLLDIKKKDIAFILEQLRQEKYQGFNITTPYKYEIIKYLDKLTPRAKKIQAVNTIYYKGGLLIGDNTDYDGFIALLDKHKITVKNKQIYLLGTGGAARAVYTALTDLGALVTVVTRDKKKNLSFFPNVISYDEIKSNKCDLFVQATPVGTFPNLEQSVLSKEQVYKKTVIDLIYNPHTTQIMKDSKRGINGQVMLAVQAIKSFEVWTDLKITITDKLINKIGKVISN